MKLYDGIFFDTYGEYYKQLKLFHDLLGPHLAYASCSFTLLILLSHSFISFKIEMMVVYLLRFHYLFFLFSFLSYLHYFISDKLRVDGRYSYFNGLAATNQFFYDVYCALVPLELLELGIQTEFKNIDMVLDEDEWKTIRQKYWTLSVYKMPMCTWQQF